MTAVEKAQHRAASNRFYQRHRELVNRRWKAYKKTHGDQIRATQRKTWQKAREAAFAAYGTKCVCCGEAEKRFLTLDHIANDGAAHRRAIRTNLTYWVRRHNYPPGFQTLCWNCNLAKRLGQCPHKEVKF